MKKLFKIITCLLSIVMITGCKTSESFSNASSNSSTESQTSSESKNAFTDYTKLQLIIGHQNVMTDEDKENGKCFTNYVDFINYSEALKTADAYYDQTRQGYATETIVEKNFAINNLYFTAQIDLTGGNQSLLFESMNLDDSILTITLNHHNFKGGGTMDVRYTFYAFFVNKSVQIDRIITKVNRTQE